VIARAQDHRHAGVPRDVVISPSIPGNAFRKSAASQKMTGGAIKVRVQHLSLKSL